MADPHCESASWLGARVDGGEKSVQVAKEASITEDEVERPGSGASNCQVNGYGETLAEAQGLSWTCRAPGAQLGGISFSFPKLPTNT